MRASVWLWWFAAITLVLGDMIPPLKPTNVKEFNTPPEGKPPPPLEDLPEALADIGVEASVSGGTDVFPLWNDPDMFPSEPPEPPPSSDPPPISPVGRWLHSAVIMGTGMYVYGGVASYNRMLDNDVWVYDLGAQDWHELQASFVPAFGNGRPDPTASEATRPKGTPAAPPFRSSPATSRAGVVAIPLKKGEDPNYMDPNLARQPKQNKPIRITYLESFVPSPLKATSYTNYDAQMHKRQHHQREQQLQQQNEQITRDVGLVANLPQPPLSSVPGGSMELIEEAANISPDTNSANSGENIDERSPFSFFAGKSSSSATAATIAMLETQATRRRHGRHGRRHHHNYRHSHGHSHSHSQESRTGTNTSHTSQQQQQQQQQPEQVDKKLVSAVVVGRVVRRVDYRRLSDFQMSSPSHIHESSSTTITGNSHTHTPSVTQLESAAGYMYGSAVLRIPTRESKKQPPPNPKLLEKLCTDLAKAIGLYTSSPSPSPSPSPRLSGRYRCGSPGCLEVVFLPRRGGESGTESSGASSSDVSALDSSSKRRSSAREREVSVERMSALALAFRAKRFLEGLNKSEISVALRKSFECQNLEYERAEVMTGHAPSRPDPSQTACQDQNTQEGHDESTASAPPSSSVEHLIPPLFSNQNYPRAYRFRAPPPRSRGSEGSAALATADESGGQDAAAAAATTTSIEQQLTQPGPSPSLGPTNNKRNKNKNAEIISPRSRMQGMLRRGYLPYDSPEVPTTPPKGTYQCSDKAQALPVTRDLINSFQTRPIWSKDAICNTLESKYANVVVTKHLQCVAYRFLKGPWRMLWIRYGYDPRKDASSRDLQLLTFKPKRKKNAELKAYFDSTEQSAFQSQSSSENKAGKTSTKRRRIASRNQNTNIDVSFQTVPVKGSMYYQLCDLAKGHSHIADLLGRSHVKRACHPTTGWYPKELFNRVKLYMDQTLDAWLKDKHKHKAQPPAKKILGDTMEMEENKVVEEQQQQQEEEEGEEESEMESEDEGQGLGPEHAQGLGLGLGGSRLDDLQKMRDMLKALQGQENQEK